MFHHIMLYTFTVHVCVGGMDYVCVRRYRRCDFVCVPTFLSSVDSRCDSSTYSPSLMSCKIVSEHVNIEDQTRMYT